MIVADAHHRVAIVGDVGGHSAELRGELMRLGVPDHGAGPLPDDLTVVQVGDLIHRGPASEPVVDLVDRHLRRQPDRWVQLLGNHESHYLRPRMFQWPEKITHAAADVIRGWWQEGLMHLAAGVRSGEEEFVVTHAGVTREYWRQVLGAPASAQDAVTRLENLARDDADAVYLAGMMLGGNEPDPLAGPLWAAPGHELIAGWLDLPMPFGQVHGHASWAATARPDVTGSLDSAIAAVTTVDLAAGHEITTLPGGRILGIDPGHSIRPRTPWRAWVLPETVEEG